MPQLTGEGKEELPSGTDWHEKLHAAESCSAPLSLCRVWQHRSPAWGPAAFQPAHCNNQPASLQDGTKSLREERLPAQQCWAPCTAALSPC